MAITLTLDTALGIGAIIVAAVAIIMFLKATEGVNKSNPEGEEQPKSLIVEVEPRKIKIPELPPITDKSQVEAARTQVRTLTLQREILGMVMKRLFEAEDNAEISREERERLSKNYEAEMRQVDEQLKKAELIVSLNELEEIRSNIIEQFQQTLAKTQQQIDLIIKELNLPQPVPEAKTEPKPKTAPKPRPRRRRPRPPPRIEEPEEEEAEEEEPSSRKEKRESIEDRLNKLKEDVLKELEELERLELEQ